MKLFIIFQYFNKRNPLSNLLRPTRLSTTHTRPHYIHTPHTNASYTYIHIRHTRSPHIHAPHTHHTHRHIHIYCTLHTHSHTTRTSKLHSVPHRHTHQSTHTHTYTHVHITCTQSPGIGHRLLIKLRFPLAWFSSSPRSQITCPRGSLQVSRL